MGANIAVRAVQTVLSTAHMRITFKSISFVASTRLLISMTEVFILLGLMLINALFVMSEIALVSARKTRLENLANKGNSNAKAALNLAENPDIFLSTAQIGITLVAILTGIYSGEKFSQHLAPLIAKVPILAPYADSISLVLVVALVTFLSIIIGELVPKRIGLLRAESIAIAVARPMLLLSKLAFPIVWLLNKITKLIFNLFNIKPSKDSLVTEEEIKAMVMEGAVSGEIDETEQQIIERVFHLGDRSITSLMTHRSDIVWLSVNSNMGELHAKAQPMPHSVYPLCDGQIDNIKGIIQLKDVILADRDTPLQSFMRPAVFVPDNNTAYQLMEKFKSTKIHSAFIVDEYGTLQGMITLNDILEAIVGDIPQAGDDDYEIVERKDGSFLVDAQLPFYDFMVKLEKEDWLDEEQEFDTVGGFIIHQLEKIPHAGETLVWRGFEFEILDMDGARIDKVLVTVLSAKRGDDAVEENPDEEEP
jgi:putative hemolysin